jgi:hypothetical protein
MTYIDKDELDEFYRMTPALRKHEIIYYWHAYGNGTSETEGYYGHFASDKFDFKTDTILFNLFDDDEFNYIQVGKKKKSLKEFKSFNDLKQYILKLL